MPGAQRTSLPNFHRISVGLILACGIVAAILVYRDARRMDEEHATNEVAKRASLRHALSREVLVRYSESLFGLSTVFTLDNEISRAEFARATLHLQQRLSGALAFEWVPYVPRKSRATVEAAMRAAHAPRPFEFVEFEANGRVRRAADRPYHYPICLIEPMRGNEIALGYDIATAPTRPFLERAREQRRFTITNKFRLIQGTDHRLGIIMICPVFQPAHDSRDLGTTGATDVFAGFVQCVFHVDELLETASATASDPVLDLMYIDGSEPDPANRILHFCPARGHQAAEHAPTEAEYRNSSRFVVEHSLDIGGREWRVLYRPLADWVATQQTSSAPLRAGAVLALTAMLAGLVTVVGRSTDTIRRQVEERTAELGESRRQFANLLHALPGMAFQGTYDTKEFHVLFVSEGSFALTGWPASDFVAGTIHLRDIVHRDDLERVRTETRTGLAEVRDIEIEFRIVSRSGEEKWVLSRSRGVYDESGRVKLVEGLIIDVTEPKRAEAARLAIERKLLETQKLESLGLLAGGIAHDFNNLLSAVLGNASLARMTLDPGNAADPQLRAIETAALRAAELCRQMLAYAGKGRFVVERVDVSALVEDILPLLRVSIARSAELRLELTRDLPGVKADATQLRQIVMNLVINAVDALAGRDGQITIRTGVSAVDVELLQHCVTGGGLPLGDYVFIEVRDTGCGMSAEVLAKIFDPFFTTKFAGRGLGLAAVLGIVRGHNGALFVESEVDRGSTFRLYLPAMVGEVARQAATDSPPAPPWRQTGDVLVIEDEEPVRIVMVELLRTFGFTVHAVGDGRAGVAAFQENASRWTLVVIDLLMPGMSGEQTLGALRAIRSDVRALLVSGYSEGEVLKRVRGPGRVAFLSKPFKREAFEEKLRELFG